MQELITQDQEIVVRNFEKRIAEFLPGAASVPQQIRLAMAQVAIAHGLDPFLKEVWPIPQKNRDGQIVGWDLMIGISGWRSSAWRSNEYWGRRFEKCSEEERKWMGAQTNDIALKCIVMRRRTGSQPMEFDGYGLFRAGHEFTKMNPLQCARYRAERDAMKAAFPISMPVGVSANVADEETGEIINGTHDHGVEWSEPIVTQQDAVIIDQPVEVAQIETPPEPEAPVVKPPTKKCTIKTSKWLTMLREMQSKTAYYDDKDGRVNAYHALAAAAKCGYETVTDENIDHVKNDLVQYALEQTIEAPPA